MKAIGGAVAAASCLLLLVGCAAPGGDMDAQPGFHLGTVAKTDIDMVAEVQQRETMRYLRLLMVKLYRRNPNQWRAHGQASLEAGVARVFDAGADWNFAELRGKRSVDCIRLAFDETYSGDRVLALTVGLASMILDAYNSKMEFYVLDDLDAQKLYNSARNVETAAWLLGHARDTHGALYLVSNSFDGSTTNLSFERLFGKIIAQQDAMAAIIANKTDRRIKAVIQNIATAVFLPI